MAGRELGAQVAEELDRQADVLLEERHDGLVDLAGLVELHRRDAQTLGVDLRRVRGVRPGDAAADVDVVTDRAGEGQPFALMIERLDDEDVGQVHAAVERIVHDEDVAGDHVVLEMAHDRFHRGRHRTQVSRQGQPLRRELAVGIGKAGRVVHVVLEHARIGRPEHGERHLVGDREDGVLEQFQRNRIVFLGHGSISRSAKRGCRRTFHAEGAAAYAAAARLRGGVRMIGARSAATSEAARRSSGTGR